MTSSKLGNFVQSLLEMVGKASIDIFCGDKTKFNERFPDSQFQMKNYKFPPFCRDRNSIYTKGKG